MADECFIRTEADLRTLYGMPNKLPAAAKADVLDELCIEFIKKSSLIFIGSSDALGRQDVSPRGDKPGFVRVVDKKTLAIPDRVGNNKLETMTNILENPQVAILFVIPGHDEVLRIFGKAKISVDPAFLAQAVIESKLPKSVIVVDIEQVYPHCGKSLRRAGLWKQESYPQRSEIPTLAAIALKMAGTRDRSVSEVDAQIQESYRTGLY